MMRKAGAKVEYVRIPQLDDVISMWSALLATAAQPSFAQRMGSLEGDRDPVDALRELCMFFIGRSAHTLVALALALTERAPHYLPNATEQLIRDAEVLRAQLAAMLSPPALASAVETTTISSLWDEKDSLAAVKKEGEYGVIVMPTFPYAAPGHSAPLLTPMDFAYTAAVNALHFPATHVPMGLNAQGLPRGVQVVGGPGCDPVTIRVAMELEKSGAGWVAPPVFQSLERAGKKGV